MYFKNLPRLLFSFCILLFILAQVYTQELREIIQDTKSRDTIIISGRVLEKGEIKPLEDRRRLKNNNYEELHQPVELRFIQDEFKSIGGLIAGATVFIKDTPFYTKTDREGRYVLTIPVSALPSMLIELCVLKENYEPYSYALALKEKATHDVLLIKNIWQEVSFKGILMDENRRPVPRAEMLFSNAFWSAQARSGTRGEYLVTFKMPKASIQTV